MTRSRPPAATPRGRLRRAVLLGGAGALLGASALWLHFRARSSSAMVAREAAERGLAALTAREKRLAQEFATEQTAPPAPRRSTAETAATPATAAPGSGSPRDLLFVQHPEWRPLFEASEKASLLQVHAAFVAKCGLSAEQSDRFAAELLRRAEADAELRRLASDRGWPITGPEFRQHQQAEETRHERELAAILGEAGLRAFRDYERTAGLQPLVDDLAQRLYFTSQPITMAVAGQIVDALARHSAAQDGKASPNTLNWDAALTELRGVLPAAQLRELERVRETAELQRQMNQIVRRATRR